MIKATSLKKITVLNLLLVSLYFAMPAGMASHSIIAFYLVINLSLLFIFLCVVKKSFVAGKKIFFIIGSGSILLAAIAIVFSLKTIYFLAANFLWIECVLTASRAANTTARTIYKLLKKNMRIAVIGYNQTTLQLAEKLQKKAKYTFEGFFDDENPQSPIAEHYSLKTMDYCLELARQKKVTDLYISSSLQGNDELEEFAKKAEHYCIRVNLINVNDSTGLHLYKLHSVSGMPVFSRYYEPLRRLRNKILKRCFDICISSFVMVFILSWLIPLIGLLIKLESKGPVFFKQLRSGRDNDSFTCYKFRSMKINSESDVRQTTKKDQRITRVGAFLRKTSIDELPQFINVLKGDMSFVGPRPHMLAHTLEYSQQVSNYMVRLYLKPGITGWAQAKGYRGEITDIELMKKRVEYDIWYLEHWSILLDIKIIWLTFISVLKGTGNAY